MRDVDTTATRPSAGDGHPVGAGWPAPAGPAITDRLYERILAEYREMPGLQLTAAQAARLWGLDPAPCERILQMLVTARRLQRRADGRFCAPGDLESAQRLSRRSVRGLTQDGCADRDATVKARTADGRAEAEFGRKLAAALEVPHWTGEWDLQPSLHALRRAGLTPAAAAAVEWLPALEMAWSGGVEPAERDCLLGLAEESAIPPEARALIATWCDARPDGPAFAAGRAVLEHRGAMLPPAAAEALLDRVLDACDAVAGAAGGWMGFMTVSGAERALRHAIYAQLAPGRV